jgi:hypothetical protein
LWAKDNKILPRNDVKAVYVFLRKLMLMAKEIESYKIGEIKVSVTESDKPNKYLVDCNDGNYHSSFLVSEYEFKNYRRLMNIRIREAFAGADSSED